MVWIWGKVEGGGGINSGPRLTDTFTHLVWSDFDPTPAEPVAQTNPLAHIRTNSITESGVNFKSECIRDEQKTPFRI